MNCVAGREAAAAPVQERSVIGQSALPPEWWLLGLSVVQKVGRAWRDPEQTVEPSIVQRLVTETSGRVAAWPTANLSAEADDEN